MSRSDDSLAAEFQRRAIRLMEEIGLSEVTPESIFTNRVHRAQYRALLTDGHRRTVEGAYREALEELLAELGEEPAPAREAGPAFQIRASGVGYQVPQKNVFDEAYKDVKKHGRHDGD